MAKSVIQGYKISALNRSDLVKPALSNQYQVNISGIPKGITEHLENIYDVKSDWISRNVGLLCADATLPTSSFATSEVKDNFQGINQQFAHTRLYIDSDFTFYVDYNYNMIKFFEGWMDYVSGENRINDMNIPGSDKESHKGFYRRFNYPNGETGYKVDTLSIVKFERDFKRSGTYLQYDFINAFPKGMTAIPVSYGAADLVKVTVTFAYDRYVVGRASKSSKDVPEPLNPETQAKPAPKSDRFLGAPTAKGLNSQQTLNELYEAGRSGKIKSASQFIGPLQ